MMNEKEEEEREEKQRSEVCKEKEGDGKVDGG